MALFLLISTLHASQTIYEDAEDGNTDGWSIYDNNPAGARIDNILDAQTNSQVIQLEGSDVLNGYQLGNFSNRAGAWNNKTESILTLDAKMDGYYMFYVIVMTEKGHRYLYYSSQNDDRGVIGDGSYIHIGLGTTHMDNQWYSESRDLVADLKRYEPDNTIISVDGLMIRGSGSVDNIILSNNQDEAEEKIYYESAEEGNTAKWTIYDNAPAGATISNIQSPTKDSHVIQFNGDGTQNGYMIGNWAGRVNAWNDTQRTQLSWDMNFAEWSMIFVNVQTTQGHRYLYYTPRASDRGLLYGEYIHHGLGNQVSSGSWFTVTRNLQADLQEYEPANTIISVNGMLIRGSGEIDNITMSTSAQEVVNSNAKIFIIGDSTVHNDSQGEMGWGSKLGTYMQHPNNAFNRARSGSSSKTYKYDSASHHDWSTTKTMMQDADTSHGAYLFIQFGHNDEKDGYTYTQPGRYNSYYTELEVYVDQARDLGFTPVLITPVSRQYVGSRTHGEYPQTMKDLASDKGVLLLDLEYKSYLEFKKYPSDAALQEVFHYDDGTHFNPNGAAIVAGWVKELACQKDQTLCGQFY